MGTTPRRAKSTELREAYFIQYCEKIRDQIKTPLMLTGGFRTSQGMQEALESKACDVIGLGRSLVLKPEFANEILSGAMTSSRVKPLTTGFKILDRNFPLEIIWYTEQIHRLGMGQNSDLGLSPLGSIVRTLLSAGSEGLKRVRAK
jgi:tRNA-dihydrouridine synthase